LLFIAVTCEQAHLRRILADYVAYFNHDRPHQGLGQRITDPVEEDVRQAGVICVTPVLGGLHHTYRRAA
jgi:hypothetical protein